MENKNGAPMLLYPHYLAQKRDKESALARIGSLAARMNDSSGNSFSMGNGYMISNGVAVVPIMGAMMKGWGYPDQSELRALMRSLKDDTSVRGVLKVFDTPGGSVAGTADYGESVAALNEVKPCVAYCEDMCCSAGYWAAANCKKVFANSTAMVGSIGVISWLEDATKMYEDMGIKSIPITTGKFKAAGDPSQEATPEIIDYMQGKIDDLYDAFISTVKAGRGLSEKAIREMNAAVFVGQKAVDCGLVDGICTLDSAFATVAKMAGKAPHSSKALNELLDLELMECE